MAGLFNEEREDFAENLDSEYIPQALFPIVPTCNYLALTASADQSVQPDEAISYDRLLERSGRTIGYNALTLDISLAPGRAYYVEVVITTNLPAAVAIYIKGVLYRESGIGMGPLTVLSTIVRTRGSTRSSLEVRYTGEAEAQLLGNNSLTIFELARHS